MKLGTRITDQSGKQGHVIRIVRGVPIARSASGEDFEVRKRAVGRPRAKTGRLVRVRINGVKGTFLAQRIGDGFRVTQDDPVWFGCELTTGVAKVVEEVAA